ncbi:MAG: cupin domain-containing protein [Acidobacteriota bacterium]|nr:cupin domain-containing protein [Acidobacteriota bacterium]
MAVLEIPDQDKVIRGYENIHAYLDARGIVFEEWHADRHPAKDADQDTILAAYQHQLKPLMEKGGYTVADVISVYPDTPNLGPIRQKFLSEHTHTEDEVRYFVEGQGLFWFNLGSDEPVFSVLCQAGDLISVPANTRHWFDLGEEPHVRAIRVFIDPSGWVPHYTESGIDKMYNPEYPA